MTPVLVVGAGGQLGRELQRIAWGPEVALTALTSAELDVTDRSAVGDAVRRHQPAVVVNAAAFTGVDQAETESGRAFAVNATAVGHLAAAADEVDALLVHVSSDYVFDGAKGDWYDEHDPTRPLGVYGHSKVAGEREAGRARRSVVLRTAWLFSALGTGFVQAILNKASAVGRVEVVDDQLGCPTSARDVAAAIAELITRTDGGRRLPPSRLFHLASPEAATWHQLAVASIGASRVAGDAVCRPITTAALGLPAPRPADSRLNSGLIERELGIVLPSWREALAAAVAEMEGDGDGR